jgi:CubicO group peptidase (beta-lactamase class C family)
VHLREDHARFDEAAALAQVLRDNPRLDFDPGERFSYSNIGYWLLGQVIEGATQQSYVDTMRANVLGPLRVSPGELSFDVSDLSRHAQGYLARFSFLNLAKGLFTDRKFWGGYTGNWLVLKSHMLNGPSFGGLVGSARGFSIFLQDQLRDESVMLDAQTRSLLETQQTTLGGDLIPMTLGWHTGEAGEVRYLYKEGGGGGFHAEMRLYPTLGIASVVMVNTTEFNSTRFLNELDRLFYEEIVHLFVHPIR